MESVATHENNECLVPRNAPQTTLLTLHLLFTIYMERIHARKTPEQVSLFVNNSAGTTVVRVRGSSKQTHSASGDGAVLDRR